MPRLMCRLARAPLNCSTSVSSICGGFTLCAPDARSTPQKCDNKPCSTPSCHILYNVLKVPCFPVTNVRAQFIASNLPVALHLSLDMADPQGDGAKSDESDSNEETEGDISTARGDTTDAKLPGADNAAAGTATDKVVNMASAAGYWAAKVGARQGKRILQVGQDWLAGGRSEDTAQLENAGNSGIDSSAMGDTEDGDNGASELNGTRVDEQRQNQPFSNTQQRARESSTQVVAEGSTTVAGRDANKHKVWTSRDSLDDKDEPRP